MKTVIVFVSHSNEVEQTYTQFVEVEQVGFFQHYKTIRQLVKELQTAYTKINKGGTSTFKIDNVVVA